MHRLFSLLFAFAIALSLTACSEKAQSSELRQLQDKDGVFVYPSLAWGMTVEETADATGWTIPEPQMVYNEKGEHVDTVALVQNVSFGGQSWSAQLQFDPQGSLWSITLAQNGKSAKLEKIFKSFEKEMTNAYGAPDAANYNKAIEAANGTVLDSTLTWEVTTGEQAGGLALSYRYIENRDMGSLALAMNHKK